MKRIALLAAIILLTITLVIVMWQLRSVAFVLLGAIAIAATMEGPVRWLQQHRWPRALAILVTYGGIIGGFLLIGVVIFAPTMSSVDPLLQDLLLRYAQIQARIGALEGPGAGLFNRFPTTEQVAIWLAGSEGETAVQSLFGMAQLAGNILTQSFLALVIAIYWSASGGRFERLWLSLLPPERRAAARLFWRKLETDVGAYIRSEVVQSLIAGALFALGYTLIDVKYALVLALLASLAWLIPIVGVAFAVIFAAVIGALDSPLVAVLAVVYTIAVLAFMEFYVERRMYTHDRYWGVLVALVMLALGDQLGLLGLLLAPPVAVTIQIALNAYLERPAQVKPVEPTNDLAELRERLQTVRGQVSTETGETALRTNSLVERLDGLLSEAEQAAPY